MVTSSGDGARRRWARAVRLLLRSLGWLCLALGAILVGAALWVRRTFGTISVDQMLAHLPAGDGTGQTSAESGYVDDFVWQAVVIPLGLVALLPMIAALVRRRLSRSARSFERPGTAVRAGRLFGRWTARLRVRSWGSGLLAAGALAVGAGMLAQTISLTQHVRSITTDLTLSAYYAEPVAELQQRPKNLVVIYLESIEDAFADETIVEENALAPLQRATRGWPRIERLTQYDGGGWTMAGIVGTQCGLPLRGTETARPDELDQIGAEADSYLPGATCLGDVLADAGYTSVFMGGADAAFASKGVFLSSHGYDRVLDLDHWIDEEVEERSYWGISDRELMEHAKQEVDRLHETSQPFNLTMLTLDTHDPAHVFDYCPVTTEVEMTSVMRCSMQQVADFVEHLEERGYLDDTVVVIMGDHERFISDQSDYHDLARADDRTIFNRIWSPDGVEFAREQADQLSVFATVLDLLGFELDEHRAGVGVSALVDDRREGSILALSPGEYQEVVESRSSDLYTVMWGLGDGETVDAEYFDPKNPDRGSDAPANGDAGAAAEARGSRGMRSAPPRRRAG